jgi:hypothetical protein
MFSRGVLLKPPNLNEPLQLIQTPIRRPEMTPPGAIQFTAFIDSIIVFLLSMKNATKALITRSYAWLLLRLLQQTQSPW